MNVVQCMHCKAPMALADLRCAQCGKEPDLTQRAEIQASRSESFIMADRLREADMALSAALSHLPSLAAARLFVRLGQAWEHKKGPAAQAAALACFIRAIEVDPSFDPGHQLWIANLCRHGQGAKARAYYEAKLKADAGDALAEKYLKVAKLAQEFVTNPIKVERPLPPPPTTLFGKLGNWFVTPSAGTYSSAASGIILTAASIIVLKTLAGQAGDSGVDSTLQRALDPTMIYGSGACSLIWLGFLLWKRTQ
jgi:hypothetical protein